MLRDAPVDTVTRIRAQLLDKTAPLAARYRALFALRNIAGADAEAALASGALFFVCCCVLFRGGGRGGRRRCGWWPCGSH
jgi:hypothetical protein